MTVLESMRKIVLDNREIYLLGTAHVSKKSVEDVSEAVELLDPDTICIELCDARYHSIRNRDAWKKTDIFTVIKQKKTLLMLSQLILSAFYRKLGQQLEVTPGAEMICGADEAEKRNKILVLADRNIEITLRRVWGGLGFFQKLKFMVSLLPSLLFSSDEIDDETVELLKETDHLEAAMNELTASFPGIRERLVDERDVYLAEKIRTAPGRKVLAVVGAAHCAGIEKHIQMPCDLAPLEQVSPKPFPILGWLIPLIIVALMVYGFVAGGAETGTESILIWFLINGVLSALGCIVALAHPLTVLTAFVAAPFTSLNPMVAAGWVAGLVQAALNKPTVADLENVPLATETMAGFWKNPLTRILLVVIFANVGSSLGTLLAGVLIAKNILG